MNITYLENYEGWIEPDDMNCDLFDIKTIIIMTHNGNRHYCASPVITDFLEKINIPMFVPKSQDELSTKIGLLEHFYNLEIILVEKKDKDLLYNVSKKYPLIFIHIPKTAGVSINDALNIAVPGHRSLKEIELSLDKSIFNSYKKVAVVRNPYDRMISLYKHALINDMKNARKAGYVGDDHSFETWFWNLAHHFHKITFQPLTLMSCYDLILNNSGEIDIDYILRFENLEEDWNNMFNELNIEPPQLPVLNTTKHEHYSKHYQCQTGEIMIKFITKMFKKDFDNFGYKFEEKN